MLSLVALGGIAAVLFSGPVSSGNRTLPSLHLEDLTWTEVHLALNDGFTTVIVPTGGTEQNGPHVILGKHNYVVRHTAGAIASRLGNALVAPVIAYVPEGETGDTPTDHMRWPGTLSVPEDVFASVLEHTARSLATHGFTRILFVGDSLGNQAAQARVAADLTAEWQSNGIQVLHVSDYYDANGQVDLLLDRGFSPEQIGRHAGLRDTSELIVAFPDGVRLRPISPPKGMSAGADGASELASDKIGADMLRLKVDAALAQIHARERTN